MWDWVNISFHTFVIVKMSNSYDWIAIKNIIPVAKVKGIALLINFSNPALKDLSSSKISVIECLIEWRKQK